MDVASYTVYALLPYTNSAVMERFVIRQDENTGDTHRLSTPAPAQEKINISKHNAAESVPRKRARTGGLGKLRLPKKSTAASPGFQPGAKASTSLASDGSSSLSNVTVGTRLDFYRSNGQDSSTGLETPMGEETGAGKAAPQIAARGGRTQSNEDFTRSMPDSAKQRSTERHAVVVTDSASLGNDQASDEQVRRGARLSCMTSYFPRMISAGASKRSQSRASSSRSDKNRSASRAGDHSSLLRDVSGRDVGSENGVEEDEVEDDEEAEKTVDEEGCGTGGQPGQGSTGKSSFTCLHPAPFRNSKTRLGGGFEREEAGGDTKPTGTTPVDKAMDVLGSDTSRRETSSNGSPKPRDPSRRRGGMASLFLTRRRCMGGRSIGNYGGRDTFRRQAMSSIFGGGITIHALRMGRIAGSGTGAGVVPGHPEGREGLSRAGVTCLEFDSMGALLAAGEMDCVSVYDFDEFLPQIPKVQPMGSEDLAKFLQPTHCIRTRRAVSCVRWNPANENELAISFLNYDEIEVFDLEGVLPNREAIPVVTLVPGSGPIRRAGSGDWPPYSRGFPSSRGTVGSTAGVPRVNGGVRGLGHMSFQFVKRGPPQSRVTHVVAGGREGTFRAWRIGASLGRITPYLQVLPSSNPRAGAFTGWLKPCANITAVCCLTPDVALVATDSGTLATFSLHPPAVKAFGSGKSAERLAQWFLGDPEIWDGIIFPSLGSERPDALRICFVHPSPDHVPWVVLCGLGSGQSLIFDTRAGRVLGATPEVSPGRVFCRTGAAGSWGAAVLACGTVPEGGQELRILATSAVAGLDGRRRGGPESTLRPGPGWELGGAAGGGFRVERSCGYHLCLPLEVERATPGRSGVLLSRDARAYLSPRIKDRLLGSNMVTSSVLIGAHEYQVEDLGRSGTSLVLDRRYQGPRVREGRVCRALMSTQDDVSTDGENEECTHREREQQTSSSGPAPSEGTRHPGGANSGSSTTVVGRAGDSESDSVECSPNGGGGDRRQSSGDAHDEVLVDISSGGRHVGDGNWDDWRPDRVRVFAKLRAIFGLDSAPISSPHLGVKYSWEKFLTSTSKVERESDQSDVAKDTEAAGAGSESHTCGSWASLPVVARAPLNLRATTLTCHPDMNFVLVGLEDGTIATVLPGKTNEDASSEG